MRVEPFSLDLDAPLATAAGEVTTREGFLVGLETTADDSSVRGIGEATPLPGWTESLDECRRALETGNPDALREADVDATTSEHDPAALATPAAAHADQLARLDLTARGRGVPLAQVLAETSSTPGSPADSVPVNATVGDADAEATVAAAREAVDDGFDCVKLKVGARPLDEDLERVGAVREAIDADLRLDANGAWDVASAARVVRDLQDRGIDVDYLEQPLPADDLDGLASLRGRGVDVAVDESLVECWIDPVLRADAADVAVLKPMALGGPATGLAAATRLRDGGVDPVLTTTVDGAVARAAAVHAAACLPGDRPCGLATADRLAEDLGPDPVPVEEGRIRVPTRPGTCGDRVDHLLWPDEG